MNSTFDKILRQQGWNANPRELITVPCSDNPVFNAAVAMAVCAYPQENNLRAGGRAEKYSKALMAYIMRISRITGGIDNLPEWVSTFKAEAMNRTLASGLRNLQRSLIIRDLITSATIMKIQHENEIKGEKTTFTMAFSPDLSNLKVELPLTKTVSGYVLSGIIPNSRLASLRAAILYHRPALQRFEGPAVKLEIRDEEYDYQNAYLRYVRPALYVRHITQLVWESVSAFHDEAEERQLPIDQILMRKAVWAEDIHIKASERIGTAIHEVRTLGVPACYCKMVHFRELSPDS